MNIKVIQNWNIFQTIKINLTNHNNMHDTSFPYSQHVIKITSTRYKLKSSTIL